MLSQDAILLSLIERPVSCGTETAWKYVETDARSSAMGPRDLFQCSGSSSFGYRRCSISDRSILCRTPGWSLAQEFPEGQNGPAAEVMQEAAMHKPVDFRRRSVDCGSPFRNREGSLPHRNIRSSQRILGRRKTVSTEPIGSMGRGEQVPGTVPIRSGVVVLVGLVAIFQAQIGVSFLETVGGR